MKRKQKWLRLSLAVYALLLRLYPAPFRARFAHEMLLVLGMQLRAARRRGGWRAVAALWGRVLWELPLTACRQHLHEFSKEKSMTSRMSKWFEYHLAALAALIVAMLLTPADPVSMLLVALPLLASYACLRESAPLPAGWRVAAVAASLAPPAFLIALGAGWVPLGNDFVPIGLPDRQPSWGLIVALTLGPLAVSSIIALAALSFAARARRVNMGDSLHPPPQSD
jgi:hypothetical protein